MARIASHRKQTAYHEVGHAIAADELGVQFDGISIVPRDGTAGRVGVEGDDGFWIPRGTDPNLPEIQAALHRWAEQQAVIDYAGHAAVSAVLGVGSMSDKSAVAAGAGPDFRKAAVRLGRDRTRIRNAKARAVEIVTARHDDVRKVAEDLMKRGRVSAQRVDHLLLDSPFLAEID